MKFCTICSLTLLVGANSASVTTKDHPIVKVITMIKGLKSTVEEEAKTEELAYEKYKYQCGVNADTLNKAIAEEKEAIDELTDTVSGETKAIAKLEANIKELSEEVLSIEATQAEKKKVRDDQEDLFKETEEHLKKTLNAISDAIVLLEGALKTTEGLVQAKVAVKKVLALVELEHVALPTGDEVDHIDKYDFKSEKVIELLKKLKEDFEAKLLAGSKEETDSLNAYALEKSNTDAMIKAAKDSSEAKTKSLAEAKAALAQATKDKTAEEKDLAADTETLQAEQTACSLKADSWAERSKTRADEVAAMEAAIQILAKVTGVQTEAPTNPVPPASPVKLLQIGADAKPNDRRTNAISKAMQLLHTTASTYHSALIEQLADEVGAKLSSAAPYDSHPFQVIMNEIEKMIFHLHEEQKKEDEQKHWCDKELATTSEMNQTKAAKIAELDAKISGEKAKVVLLTTDIGKANKMISDIQEFQAEATEARQVGKKENAVALQEAKDAQTALANAMAVLTEYYKSTGMVKKEAWEFLQDPVALPDDPKTWESSYTGVADPTNAQKGIISILGKVAADFAAMEASIVSSEEEDVKAYNDEMSKATIEKSERQAEVESKGFEKSQRVAKLGELSATHKRLTAERSKTMEYWTDLQKACVEADSTYADRKAARTSEIEGLEDAEAILKDAFEPKLFLQVRGRKRA